MRINILPQWITAVIFLLLMIPYQLVLKLHCYYTDKAIIISKGQTFDIFTQLPANFMLRASKCEV